jgi:hypothetical protein
VSHDPLWLANKLLHPAHLCISPLHDHLLRCLLPLNLEKNLHSAICTTPVALRPFATEGVTLFNLSLHGLRPRVHKRLAVLCHDDHAILHVEVGVIDMNKLGVIDMNKLREAQWHYTWPQKETTTITQAYLDWNHSASSKFKVSHSRRGVNA